MRLAEEETTLTMGGERIILRPSLRAAARLERRYDGFPAIMKALEEASVTVIADLIGECATAPTTVPTILVEAGMAWRLMPIVPALQVLVLGLMGYDPDAEENQAGDDDESARITFAEVHARLFKLATGWLGWTPAQAWAASPAEIRHAYEGRLELLRAVFGGGDEQPGKPKRAANLDDKFAALMGHLATLPGAEAA